MTQTAAVAQFNPDQLKLVRETVAKGTTEAEFKLFIEVCRYRGLNPFARQIYAIVRSAHDPAKRQMTIQTSIDGFRLLAERSGEYRGQIGPEWCGEDGIWKDVWLKDTPPVAARVGILRKGFEHPVWGIAKYKAFYIESNPLWKKMSDHMLALRAESIGLRKTFPDQMSGIYTKEEMEQADDDLPTVTVNGTTVDAETIITPVQQAQETHAGPTTQQLSSIDKLCEHLGKPSPAQGELTYESAKELIQKLSAEYRDVQDMRREREKGMSAKPAQSEAIRKMIANAKAKCATVQMLWEDAKTDANLARVEDELLTVAQVVQINGVIAEYSKKMVAAK